MIFNRQPALFILVTFFFSLSSGLVLAIEPEPEPPVVIFDTDMALPGIPASTAPGTPVCIDDGSGLLVAGCEGVEGPPGPIGPPGPQGEQGLPGEEADLNEVIIPLCELYELAGQALPSICDIHECGNGVLEYTEECDDGNLENGDGCSANCLLPCEDADTRVCTRENANGICHGIETCDLGEWDSGSCTAIEPNIEVCDSIDNDCNGSIDDIEPVSCSLTVGVCSGSTRRCTDGFLFPCVADDYGPNYEPEELSCDGLDNDCDGQYDEPFYDGTVTYTSPDGQTGLVLEERCGVGACFGGTVECGSDEMTLECSTIDQVTAEVCDDIDNDCDGVIDNIDPIPCSLQLGVCAGSTRTCVAGQLNICSDVDYGQNYEAEELSCDGLDNDCDGQVDEGCDTPLGSSCATGEQCTSGFCVDDVCCDTACDGQAESCIFIKTGYEDGICFKDMP